MLTNKTDTRVHDNTDNTYGDEQISTPLASQGVSKCRQLTGGTNSNIQQFTGYVTAKRQNMAPYIHKDFTLYNVLMLYFTAVITLLMEETNWYYQQYFDLMMDLLQYLTSLNLKCCCF
jgi:hypothetical protein